MIWISLPEYTVLLVYDKDGIIYDAPPIVDWTLGRSVGYVSRYYRSRRARIRFPR